MKTIVNAMKSLIFILAGVLLYPISAMIYGCAMPMWIEHYFTVMQRLRMRLFREDFSE